MRKLLTRSPSPEHNAQFVIYKTVYHSALKFAEHLPFIILFFNRISQSHYPFKKGFPLSHSLTLAVAAAHPIYPRSFLKRRRCQLSLMRYDRRSSLCLPAIRSLAALQTCRSLWRMTPGTLSLVYAVCQSSATFYLWRTGKATQ